jgi:hypothetical protein
MLILLDIDGVMVPAASWKAPELLEDGFPNFSTRAVNGLRRIISETGATILLTTSHKSKYSVSGWRNIFAHRGINTTISKLNNHNHDTRKTRKEEVLNWIKKNKGDNNFIIIDDDKSLNDLPFEIKRKLILTSPLIGLNENLAEQAIEALNHNSELASSK